VTPTGQAAPVMAGIARLTFARLPSLAVIATGS